MTLGITIAIALASGMSWPMWSAPFAPEQPIDFNHRDHIQGDRLACELCHSGARRSAFAGMPPVERCMGCHRFVLPQNPGVTALRRYWQAGKSIPWIKVNALPRFVRFRHDAHVLASVDCSRCHGNVAAMNRIARVAPLTMGWCVDCHRTARAPDDCLTCHY
jgi:hypothetical protein